MKCRWKRLSRRWILSGTGITLFLCLSLGFGNSSAWAQLPETCQDFSSGLVDHVCFHAENGPFAEAWATRGDAPTPFTPEINAPHTLYNVRLISDSPSSVLFTPHSTGTWAVMTLPGVDFEIRAVGTTEGEAGELVPVLLHNEAVACPPLPRAQAFFLQTELSYVFTFSPTTLASVPVSLEKMEDFSASYGIDGDGDGFGGQEHVVTSICAPPPGYANNANDCDDQNPEIHPEALESCNGVDDNCNGKVDDLADSNDSCEEGCAITGRGNQHFPGRWAGFGLWLAVLGFLRPRFRNRWMNSLRRLQKRWFEGFRR